MNHYQPDTNDPAASLTPGSMVDGKYEIQSLIAGGGMGFIYRAMMYPAEQPVALKVMRSELRRDESAVKRFIREAETIMKLHHPHAVHVLGTGRSRDNMLYIAMEWLEGQDVGQVLMQHGPLEHVRAARICLQTSMVLEESHAKGIVHRDLKPENIFLQELVGKRDFVKVLDFGLAKIVNAPAQTQITRFGMLCGTPEFMSPEQGRAQPLDGRSDVYALGCVLYTMLLARPPFVGETPLDIVMRHFSEPFPQLPSHIAPPLADIIYRATQKDPNARFANAHELSAALRAFIESTGVPDGLYDRSDTQEVAGEESGERVFVGSHHPAMGEAATRFISAMPDDPRMSGQRATASPPDEDASLAKIYIGIAAFAALLLILIIAIAVVAT